MPFVRFVPPDPEGLVWAELVYELVYGLVHWLVHWLVYRGDLVRPGSCAGLVGHSMLN